MKNYFDVTSGCICYGSFTKEKWANAFAAKLLSEGFENVEVEIQDFIVSTQREFDEKMKRDFLKFQ